MKISKLALLGFAAAFTAATALPPFARADDDDYDDGGRETIEIRKRVHHGDEDGDGERDGGRRERREGMGGREGRGGRMGMGGDPAMREKLDKVRELERKVHGLAKGLTQGSEAEKAAAKTEARKALGELYDAKLALEVAMLEKMEKHAAELRAKIAKKKSGKEKAVENRLTRMTGEGDDW